MAHGLQSGVDERDLYLTRIFDSPADAVFKAWTQPDLLKQWIAPLPNTVPVAELDVRPGGASYIVMRTPDGTEIPLKGVYLEVIENERIVTTDAYTEAWELSEKPFITIVLNFEALGACRTRYNARIRHWTVGPYEGLAAAWPLLHDWIERNGSTAATDLWECYLFGPESSSEPSKWRTELNQPLVG
ncbi:MAG: SRPBCC domain-containing protein [Verrucomicrobiae bacterium]|nr:SRPBCC domain-containing protein [Verrucomicrobiae bacterium]